MPTDTYLSPTNLKVDQIIARNYGHVRSNKYYWPEVKAVFSWATPEIFNDQADFYSATVACQSNFTTGADLTTYTNNDYGSVSVGNYYNLTGIIGRQNKRVVIDVDINGNNLSDTYSTQDGSIKCIGFSVKTRANVATAWGGADPAGRTSSAVVSVGIGINSALVLPRRYNSPYTPVATASFATNLITNNPVGLGYTGGAPSTLTFSAATISAGSFVVTVPFRSTQQSGNAPGILIPWSQSTGPDEVVNEIYKVSVLSGGSTVVSGYLSVSNIVTVSSGGFSGIFSGVPTTGSYEIRVEEKRPAIYSSITGGSTAVNYDLFLAAVCCQGVSTVSVSSTMTLSGLDTAVVTGGGAITGGGIFSVSTVAIATAVSALAQDWAIQDLQINLRTRAVETSLTSIKIKPNDTAILGLLFHDGTYVMDPGITNLKLAARNSTNTAAYRVYNTDTTVVSVGDTNYFQIQLLANDSDLLDNQNSNLLAGSNAAQSLLGEIQWTTTRGTFSSDTFTINVPSEVVREPDV